MDGTEPVLCAIGSFAETSVRHMRCQSSSRRKSISKPSESTKRQVTSRTNVTLFVCHAYLFLMDVVDDERRVIWRRGRSAVTTSYHDDKSVLFIVGESCPLLTGKSNVRCWTREDSLAGRCRGRHASGKLNASSFTIEDPHHTMVEGEYIYMMKWLERWPTSVKQGIRLGVCGKLET